VNTATYQTAGESTRPQTTNGQTETGHQEAGATQRSNRKQRGERPKKHKEQASARTWRDAVRGRFAAPR
jgi:hypothetical protein